MADWQRLRERLRDVDRRVTLTWDEIDSLVGGLPPSASRYRPYWGGDRGQWSGFSTTDVRLGRSVTFVRRESSPPALVASAARELGTDKGNGPDVVLVSCSKGKLSYPAPARQLYTSPLFQKARDYAEGTGARWFVLSALHGLVSPDAVVEPYDLTLSTASREYRRSWSQHVYEQLREALGSLEGLDVEIHAGRKYADDLVPLLARAGCDVRQPLDGLTQGRRLAWYGDRPLAGPMAEQPIARREQHVPDSAIVELITQLSDASRATTPAEISASNDPQLARPGMYSWWVDPAGAADLEAGLGYRVSPGLIYAGLAGATRRRSGRRSTNTLRGRLVGMHLGRRYHFSTFRYSLGSILATTWGDDDIDEARLTQWMHEHLRVVALPVDDADVLEEIEDRVLAELNPPLNLAKVGRDPLRRRLTALRSRFRRTRAVDATGQRLLPEQQ